MGPTEPTIVSKTPRAGVSPLMRPVESSGSGASERSGRRRSLPGGVEQRGQIPSRRSAPHCGHRSGWFMPETRLCRVSVVRALGCHYFDCRLSFPYNRATWSWQLYPVIPWPRLMTCPGES